MNNNQNNNQALDNHSDDDTESMPEIETETEFDFDDLFEKYDDTTGSLVASHYEVEDDSMGCFLQFVFNNLEPLTNLDLSNSELTEVGFYSLAAGLNRLDSLTSLDVSFNPLVQADGFRELSNAINLHPTITLLSLRGCDLGARALVLQYFLSTAKILSCLNLAENLLGDDTAGLLIDSILQNNAAPFRDLDLCCNNLSASFLYHSFSRYQRNPNFSLDSLGLSYNNFSQSSLDFFVPYLRNSTVRELDILENDITLNWNFFSRELLNQDNLVRLDLSNNMLTDVGAEDISIYLKRCCKLRDLALDDVEIETQGCDLICDALMHSDCVNKLSLQSNGINNKEINCLVNYLMATKVLTDLNLGCNDLCFKSLNSISKTLLINSTLKKLNLHYNEFKCDVDYDYSTLSYFAECVSNNHTLTSLNISNNNIFKKSSFFILSLIQSNLRYLNISKNNFDCHFSEEDCIRLISINNYIEHINMKGCGIGFLRRRGFNAEAGIINYSKIPWSLRRLVCVNNYYKNLIENMIFPNIVEKPKYNIVFGGHHLRASKKSRTAIKYGGFSLLKDMPPELMPRVFEHLVGKGCIKPRAKVGFNF